MVKRFEDWIILKKTLHNSNSQPPYVSTGDIWWISVGENVGSEINGKSDLFSRPVIILKKLSHGFYFVIPTTTQDHTGSWYVNFLHKSRSITACLHQARSIDFHRLSSKIGTMDDTDFKRVKEGFLNLYK